MAATKISAVALIACVIVAFHSLGALAAISVNIADNGAQYSVLVGGVTWFNSSPFQSVAYHANGQWYSASDGSLNAVSSSSFNGTDAWGAYEATSFDWALQQGGVASFRTAFRTYSDLNAIVFSQQFLTNVQGTSVQDPERVSTSFPAFLVEGEAGQRGYMQWTGSMLAFDHIGGWNNNTADLVSGTKSGPVVVFNSQGDAFVLSPMKNFMTGSFFSNTEQAGMNILQSGLLGSLTSVPVGYEYATVAFYDSNGPNAAVEKWGAAMLRYYGKNPRVYDTDLSVNYLGYWTDNGAYYYYQTEPGTNYQQTLIDVKSYADKVGIPYRYLQLDSWWYYKENGDSGGVTNWTARPDIFPDGTEAVFQQTQWPIVAHNRYWSTKTVYAKQNGGQFDFIVDTNFAIPNERAFWDYLMTSSLSWGLAVYEQDWLYNEFMGLNATLQSPSLARTWLMQMGQAAQAAGLTIQYCMPYPRHALQSLEIEAVDQIRVSDDYHPDNPQWQIGTSCMLAHAIGLACFKDNFWTSTVQPGNPYNLTEDYAWLESAIATYSGGPVGPSDAIGYSDVDLIMRSCTADGELLQPSAPARAMDIMLYQQAFGSGGPSGEMYWAESWVDQWVFLHFIAVDLTAPFSLLTTMIRTQPTATVAYFYNFTETVTVQPFDLNHPIYFKACDRSTFQIWHLSPVLSNGWAVLGELSKWVPIASERIKGIDVTSSSVTLNLHGVVGESVVMTFLDPSNNVVKVPCTFGSSGSASVSVPSNTCFTQ